MTDDELWAAIGAGIRKQGRCIRIVGSDNDPRITTPLRPRKKSRAAHWQAYLKMSGRASTTS